MFFWTPKISPNDLPNGAQMGTIFDKNSKKMDWEATGGGPGTEIEKKLKNGPVWDPLKPRKLSSRVDGSSIFTFPRGTEK